MEEKYFQRGFGLKNEIKDKLLQDYHSSIVDLVKASNYELSAGDTTIKLAKDFGFCYGVDRSIEYAYQTLEKFPDKKIYLTGEIIHNPFVNNKLLEKGIHFLGGQYNNGEKLSDIKEEDIIILPAFGVSTTYFEDLKKLNCILVDTTCGSVLNVWKNVEKFSKEGFTAVVHGKYYHEETIATVSRINHRSENAYIVIRNFNEAERICNYIREPKNKTDFLSHFMKSVSDGFDPDKHLNKVGMANQTTMLINESQKISDMICDAVRDRYGKKKLDKHFRSFDTICSATQERQDAIIELLESNIDMTLIIGGYNSSNTNNLTNIAVKYGPAFHIDDEACLKDAISIEHQPAGQNKIITSRNWLLKGKLTIALTAGASTPNKKIGEVIEKIFLLRGEKNLMNKNIGEKLRRKTVTVPVGDVKIGSDHPIVVQSMTNTGTANVKDTVEQIIKLKNAGSELVRVTVNNDEAAKTIPLIFEKLDQQNITLPIIGDFHYNGHLLLTGHSECAELLSKYRINPGNVGSQHRDKNFASIIEVAIKHDKPVRIGVNWGSLDKQILTEIMDENNKRTDPLPSEEITIQALVKSALQSAKFAEEVGLAHDKIILSAKVSEVQSLVSVYSLLAQQCDYPLHLGLTEAGMGSKGIIASTAGLAILLYQGIGDTIRVSLTPQPGDDRTDEVYVSQQILQSLEIRNFIPQVSACPGCGRTNSDFFQRLALDIQNFMKEQIPEWRVKYPLVEDLKIAIMGCVVNGPGESKHADIGISLPGSGENPKAPVYIDGKLSKTLTGDTIVKDFQDLLCNYVEKRYSRQ